MEQDHWLQLFVSLCMGLLVGLQRESTKSETAGIRTFPLITLFGTVSAMIGQQYTGWIVAGGFLALAAILVTGSLGKVKAGDETGGLTTEVAVLLMYALGAYLVYGNMAIAVVLTGTITVLLHFKSSLHGFVDKIGDADFRAIMQFVLISMVILPVLPDKTYDRYQVINPRDIWMMVVLIVGIGIAGYFLYKLFGKKAGVLLGGILGGLISSTATTLSYAKKAVQSPAAAKLAAFVILTASAVSLVRVLVEVSVVAPRSFPQMMIPLGLELGSMIFLVIFLFFRHRKEKNEMPEQENPAQLKAAIIFAALYAAISFVSEFVKDKFGDDALYAVSIVSGLTDLDAITLSTSKMTEAGEIETRLGWRLILLAVMANLVFKAILCFVVGNRYLGRLVSILFALLIATGLAIFFLWPS